MQTAPQALRRQAVRPEERQVRRDAMREAREFRREGAVRPEERRVRREAMRERKEDLRREEIRAEYWDDWDHSRYRVDVGTVYWSDSSDDDDDSCEVFVGTDGVTYYRCGGTRYRRAYSGGSVTYVDVGGRRNN